MARATSMPRRAYSAWRAVARAAVFDAVAPLKGKDGKQQRAETLEPMFEKYADEHVASLGGERTTLNKQKVAIDQHAVEQVSVRRPFGGVCHRGIGGE